ncbi:MAG: cupin domain-containing protein [Gloeomargaritaceae cyanobacterium C42_A2020_066]|nr:cupin domain-containing protein [Gloeomargaritaceae cyanobacterium C42_A2020_066]
MWVRHLMDCVPFVAGDGTELRELIHPDKHPLALRYSLAWAWLPAGRTSVPHSLVTSEVYVVLKGTGLMHINEEVQRIQPGDVVYIPPQAVQFVHNDGQEILEFLCLVDPAWRQEDETVYAPAPSS